MEYLASNHSDLCLQILGKPKREEQTFLAFDWGEKRIGLAFGTSLLGQARPLSTLHSQENSVRFAQIEKQIQTWQPDALVVGMPLHPDGQAHAVSARALRFARQLHGRTNLCVYLVDERYTSVLAEQEGASDLDAGAATIILGDFLRSLQK